jgi:hypothetical protein
MPEDKEQKVLKVQLALNIGVVAEKLENQV